ncbi:MAG: hypothetical protein LC737_07590, partial [Chloroflexi bacterium]|nr:hypothetical protein [Chloroflexota bacterium]
MRKAITLNVRLYIEGDAPPAEDFEQLTTKAVKDLIAQGQKKSKLKFTIREVKEIEGDDSDDADAVKPQSNKVQASA